VRFENKIIRREDWMLDKKLLGLQAQLAEQLVARGS
jgi:hypothetical protein